ncbi:hypothetical protein EJP67_33370 [Variovorax guangxiensis]|uniref:Uncharacterized protein n=1 Tax=Variovorax guangxiensis TaxID=1775474 RepID=A0A433MVU9_9BURK|nr:hypothetical protein [Variovorax guangxiensis]RUR71948.1 hypothetical protein EJP67_33370 [Variovorax guangxiensis]
MTAQARTVLRDPRFSLRREFTGQPTAMWVIRFCGAWIGLQFQTRATARAARRAAIVARNEAPGSPVKE